MIAGQGLAEQGHSHPMAPSPRLEENLPLPKERASRLYDHVPADRRAAPAGSPGLTHSVSTGLSQPGMNAVSMPSVPSLDAVQPFDAAHYQQVYEEFTSAKRRVGESVEGLTLQSFSAKLRASEGALIDEHGCRAVRFQVLVKGNVVSLRPQLVR